MLTQLSRMSSIRNRIGPNKLKRLTINLKVLELVFDFGGAGAEPDCEPAPGGEE